MGLGVRVRVRVRNEVGAGGPGLAQLVLEAMHLCLRLQQLLLKGVPCLERRLKVLLHLIRRGADKVPGLTP